jgi:CheY-like chemotaxis protein
MKSKSLSVLVADDEKPVRTVIQLYLEEAGHRATCVVSATEAREILKGHTFDLIITDILMPEGDGVELIGEFRNTQPTGRILAISGGGRYIGSDNCLNIASGLGAHAVLMKPFNYDQLLAAIARALAAPSQPP